MQKERILKSQENLYNRKAEGYLRHHGDPYSQKYRTKFIRDRLFDPELGIDLNRKKVLDAMAAFGPETGYLIEKGADVMGLDISPANAELYEKKWNKKCIVASVHQTGLPESYFDLIYICGGLHHILPLLDETMIEMRRILKLGGYLCFMEPNKDTWLNLIRALWYKLDKRFGEYESAIGYRKHLEKYLDMGFNEVRYQTGGNVAYILISQSLIMGIPSNIKKLIYKPLFFLEDILEKLPLIPQLFLLGVWRKV